MTSDERMPQRRLLWDFGAECQGLSSRRLSDSSRGDKPLGSLIGLGSLLRLSQDCLQVGIGCCDRRNVELLDEDVQDRWRDERWEARSQADVLDAEMQERK